MNLIVMDKRKGEVIHFVKDCEVKGRNYIGSNVRLLGLKPAAHALVWTNDEIAETETPKALPRGRSIRSRRYDGRKVAEAQAPGPWRETMIENVNRATSIEELKSLMLEIIGRL